MGTRVPDPGRVDMSVTTGNLLKSLCVIHVVIFSCDHITEIFSRCGFSLKVKVARRQLECQRPQLLGWDAMVPCLSKQRWCLVAKLEQHSWLGDRIPGSQAWLYLHSVILSELSILPELQFLWLWNGVDTDSCPFPATCWFAAQESCQNFLFYSVIRRFWRQVNDPFRDLA